jgi:hypothetical protein
MSVDIKSESKMCDIPTHLYINKIFSRAQLVRRMMLITCLNIVAVNDFNYAQALHSADCVPIAHFLKGTLSYDSVHFFFLIDL